MVDTFQNGLKPLLRGLDRLLERALEIAAKTWAGETPISRFRGLYLSEGEMDQLLRRQPCDPTYSPGDFLCICNGNGRAKELREKFYLTPFEVAVVMIALAPELDLRYERLYAYLQDDVTRKRPTVDLALNLLCSSAEERLRQRSCFADSSPLLRHRIIHRFPDPNHVQPPVLAHYFKVDEQIIRWLLEAVKRENVDGRLISFCRFIAPNERMNRVPVNGTIRAALHHLFESCQIHQDKLVLHFNGNSRVQMRDAALDAVATRGSRLLTADFSRHPAVGTEFEEAVSLALREAELIQAIPFLVGIANLSLLSKITAFVEHRGIIILSSTKGSSPGIEGIRVLSVEFPPLNVELAKTCWQSTLKEHGIELDEATIDVLSRRFRMAPEQIGQAVEESCGRAEWRRFSQAEINTKNSGPRPDDLYAAARAQSRPDLATVARKLEPVYTWDDAVLPSNTVTQLHEICARIKHQERVMGDWGFGRKLSSGKGTTALFAGHSGTGKTMSAEIIANEVQLDLYKIDLAGVVSKYIGETEKNLDRIFTAAEGSNAILFFDEADALFGKRSEVRDSHDRYANIEISYLLEKMDAYEGIAILATNLRQHMDEAFTRRLAFSVLFPFPDESHRRLIWQRIWPAETPVADDVDFDDLARRFKLSGGNIKNIALAAAFLAASDGGVVTTDHLFHATGREFEKMGKSLSREELYGFTENETQSRMMANH